VAELLVEVLAGADVETVCGVPRTSRGYQLAWGRSETRCAQCRI